MVSRILWSSRLLSASDSVIANHASFLKYKRFNFSLTTLSAVPFADSVVVNSPLVCTHTTRSFTSVVKMPRNKAKALVKAANEQTDLMASLTAFKKFHKNGVHLRIQCDKVSKLHKGFINWALDLTRENMRNFYEDSEWGWSEEAKRTELSNENAWYLVVTNNKGESVAFVHFRFDLDYGIQVLYCYEIQLHESVRRVGLGQYLMLIMELIAMKTKMHKVMLTVFKHNIAGRTFFNKKLRYELDETSPTNRNVTYEILSKKINMQTETFSKKQPLQNPDKTNNSATSILKTSNEEKTVKDQKRSKSEENLHSRCSQKHNLPNKSVKWERITLFDEADCSENLK